MILNSSPKKTVLLTGVSQGLGLFLCKELTKYNFNVIGVDQTDKSSLLPELHALLYNYYTFNLSKTTEIPILIRQIITENGSIHILINNAGMKSFKLLSDYSDDDFRKVVDVNFLAPALLIKQLLPFMREQKYGRIINIASNAGFKGYKRGSAYCSTKGALHLFTEAMAPEIPKGITINTISPSTISTPEIVESNPNIKLGKLISPQKVFTIILKIIGSEINGKVFPIINFRSKVKYLGADICKYLFWFTHS